MQLPFALTLGGLLVGVLGFCLGVATTAYETGDDLNKFVLPFLSMVGTWVSGLGALAAVLAALHIATRQAAEQHTHAAVKCAHHSMALVNDLRSRVSYQRKVLYDGSVPLAALATNIQGIERRYEALYDREIYQYLPGALIDRITALAGSIFGLSALSSAVASTLENKLHAVIPARSTGTEKQEQDIVSLEAELDELFSALQTFRRQLEP